MIRTVDYRPLLAEPSQDETARFRAAAQSSPAYAAASGNGVFQGVVLGCAGFLVVAGIAAIGLTMAVFLAAVNLVVSVLVAIAVLVLAGGLGALTVWGSVALVRRFGGRWSKWYRLEAFARANAMVFSPRDPDPAYPGLIFDLGGSRAAVDHLRSAADRYLDYGNYQFVTSDGKNSTTHTWGFLALELDRTLPHMVLDARGNDGFLGSNLPASFDRSQVLSLEGDFDRWFTLYCPRRYERDALYVFTPDLMALLIDEAAPFDVELIDRWMLVYSSRGFDMLQPGVHERLLRIVDTVGRKTLTQTVRYVDERIGAFEPNIVAPPGQRLKRRLPVWAIVVLSVVGFSMLVPLLAILLAVIGALGRTG